MKRKQRQGEIEVREAFADIEGKNETKKVKKGEMSCKQHISAEATCVFKS